MQDKVFYNLLKIANDNFGLTKKKDIAEKIGATSQKMTNWKTRGVPTSEYENIAKRLNVKVDDLLNYAFGNSTSDKTEHASSEKGEQDLNLDSATPEELAKIILVYKESDEIKQQALQKLANLPTEKLSAIMNLIGE